MARADIAFVLFPNVTLLDLVGPLQVLKQLPPPFRTVVVGARAEPMPTDTGLALQPQYTFDEVPQPKMVLVPGGAGSVAAMADAVLQSYLRAAAAGCDIVASVCTGSLVLAAAGLLAGRDATTHWAYARELEALGARYLRQRWVESGTFITAAGVSAGIDLALVLAARLTDPATAARIQLSIEYDPEPPFGRIAWDNVGSADLERQRRGGTGHALQQASTLLAGCPDLLRRLTRGSED